ncbi:MAG TPA: CAP domain-containing protein, partial [Acidimicrobiales bacterium]|nr:CAP domain-containing protein [Acidimicrobiales bacterium]
MRRWLSLAMFVATGAAACLSLASPANAADPPNEGRVVAFVNDQRAAAGLPALSTNATLVNVARAWTDQLLVTGSLAHNGQLGSQAPGPWAGLGENVGYGPTIDAVDQAFMNSPGHRANILGDYDAVGVGVDWRSDGTAFVTVDFLKWLPGSTQTAFSSAPAAASVSPATSVSPSPSTATGYYVL